MYTYVFVIYQQKVGVFKHTKQGGLLFVCMQEDREDFFENFNEIYNIDSHKARDFCFVWEEGCNSALLQSPYSKSLSERSLWGPDLLCELLHLLYTQHGIRGCLLDSRGHLLGEATGSVRLYTNANLSPQQETYNPHDPIVFHEHQSEWQKEQLQILQEQRKARGIAPKVPSSPKATTCKLPKQGGDQAPNMDEHNH
ncbi:hypothetical protein [Helicobacter salomonis]|uniref:hypothetical protein n=1 Tax=Helicobacter salomonis TaxID=56878 RepID=UPI000CF0C17F|nr:hypothetical protein [Helicobacter salomonis]